jgi:MATE family multidrug resistance protein
MGKNVGSGNIPAIKHFYKVGLIIAGTYAVITTSTLRIFRNWWQTLYTNDQLILDEMTQPWTLFTYFVMLNQFAGICNSALIASGKQNTGSIINFMGYFLIGFPYVYSNLFVK